MTFFTFDDHEIPTDTRRVLQASALLEVTEFQVFDLAYRRWYRKPADPDLLEKHYTVYMFREQAPPWVRQFCREVLEAASDDALVPADFGVEPRIEDDSMARRGIRLGIIVVGVTVTLHIIAELVAHY